MNPDGAEWALADKPKEIRSVTRPYPYMEDHIEGLVWGEDINGDGRILQMRIKDSNGAWKVHPSEPRLMIRRDPIEMGGTYYRILPEGLLKNYDGVTIKPRRPKESLDLNRTSPANRRPESDQRGAGDFPPSESEARNLVEFVLRHKNITGTISFHTMSGVLLRGFSDIPDDHQPTEDLWTYEKIGAKGTELTGYPHISTFHKFKYYPHSNFYHLYPSYRSTRAYPWVYDKEISLQSNPTVSGLFSATFGNAIELIIAIIALSAGLIEVVQASLIGSIIGNILLLVGISIFAGGLQYKNQRFNNQTIAVSSTMLIIVVAGLSIPSIYAILNPQDPENQLLSSAVAVVMALIYLAGLVFSLRTHKEIFSMRVTR